jgi:hypothetical protein
VRPALALVLALSSAAAAQQAEPARTGFTLTRTELDVQLIPADQSAEVNGKLTVRNDGTLALTQIFLQLTSTSNWQSVARDAAKLSFTEHKVKSDADHTGIVNEARVVLDRPLPAHGTVTLDVHYTVRVQLGSERLTALGAPFKAAVQTDWDRIATDFTAVRGIGYVLWYPAAVEPASMSEGNAAFEAIVRWKAREAASTFIAHIHQADRQSDKTYEPLGMSVPVLTGPAQPTMVRNSVALVAQPSSTGVLTFSRSAEEFAELYLPPRTALAKVWELPDPGDAPYVSANEVFVHPAMDEPDIQAVELYAVEHAALHSPRPWIQEGYAGFLDAAWREHDRGRNAALSFLDDRMGALALSEPDNINTADTSLINSAEEIYYRTKAMFVWWMLRDIAGDAALQRAIKRYRPEDDRSADYEQKLVEAEAHRSLEWFFDDWVYRDRGLPEFSIPVATSRQSMKGEWVTEVTVQNDGGAGAYLPVVLEVNGDTQEKRVIVAARSKVVVSFTTAVKPTSVRVNDGTIPETDRNNNEFEFK